MDAVELTKKLLEIDSSKDEMELLCFIEDLLRENGAEVKRLPVGEKFNLLATKNNVKEGILLCGHCDTVPTEKHYEPHINEGKLFGIGASDMKSGLAVCIASFLSSKSDVGLMVTVEEETTFAGAKALTKEMVEGFSYAIVAEPTNLKIYDRQYGLARFKINLKGEQRHTANIHEGVHPVNLLVRKLSKFLTTFKEEFPESIAAINQIEAGYKMNVIPSQASGWIDVRVSPSDSLDRVKNLIRDNFEAEFVTLHEPVCAKISPLNKNLKEVSEERFVFRGFTEMYFYEMLGLDTVILGPGLMEKAHEKNEYVPVENIKRFEDMLTKICRRTPRE